MIAFWPVLFSQFGFLFRYPRQEPCGVNGFSDIFTPPRRACKHKYLQGRLRASASACRGGFVQAQVLAGAISCKRKRLHEITPASPYACTRPPVLPLYKTGGLGPQTPLERRTQGSPHTGVAAPFRSYSPPPRPRPQLRKPCLQRAPSGKR